MWQPAIGGLAIGLVLTFVPEVRGVGYEHIDQALNGGLVLKVMIVLCVVKGGATIISYSTGNAGGIFAPSLFLGAMVGGTVGLLVQQQTFFPVGAPGAYALVGMGALFAGIIRAPLTSVFMIFEVTQDYQIFVPLMVANMISLFISRRYQPEPVYRALLKQDGVHLPEKFVKQSAGGWRAGDVMSREIPFVEPGTTATVALEMASRGDVACFLVGRRDGVTGLVSQERLAEEVAAGRAETPVVEITTESWTHVHPDHGIDVVLDRYRQNPGVLPVLSRVNVHTVVGVVTQETLMRVFGTKATVKTAAVPPTGPTPAART
jgi:CIC family chloride channel protein